ncbi:hypothetical protein pb186bvf_004430 [Paramecium bursaria]
MGCISHKAHICHENSNQFKKSDRDFDEFQILDIKLTLRMMQNNARNNLAQIKYSTILKRRAQKAQESSTKENN